MRKPANKTRIRNRNCGETPQFGSPKVRSSVSTHCIDSPSAVHNAEKDSTASIRSKLWRRIIAPPKSIGRSSFVLESQNVTTSPAISVTRPTQETTKAGRCPKNSTLTSGFFVCHLPTIFQKLSVNEGMFVLHIYNWGLRRANYLAARFHYKLQQPLPVLLEALCELDKSCNEQNAAQEPHAGSQSSSRKRS
jgi:hypothetical protein